MVSNIIVKIDVIKITVILLSFEKFFSNNPAAKPTIPSAIEYIPIFVFFLCSLK